MEQVKAMLFTQLGKTLNQLFLQRGTLCKQLRSDVLVPHDDWDNLILASDTAALVEACPDKVEPLSWDLFEKGLQLPSTKYLGSLTRLQQISRELIGWWSDIDVLLTPGLGQRPVPIGTINPQKEEDPFTALIPDASDFTPYTAVWNVTGQPAISLPLFQGDDGLPTSIQLVGPPIGEELLLSLASQVEAERPWADRRPELVGGAA